MQKWEYTKVYDPNENKLNELGDQGWELMSVVADVSGTADETSSSIYAYLKRPK
jgi:hypothetical protein